MKPETIENHQNLTNDDFKERAVRWNVILNNLNKYRESRVIQNREKKKSNLKSDHPSHQIN